MSVLSVKNLTKVYKNGKGVKNVNLSISKPSILGLLGPNGAGKTTIIETILGLRKKNSGEIIIFSKNKIDISVKNLLGFQLQSTYLDGNLRVLEYINLYKTIFTDTFPLETLTELFGIKSIINRNLSTLSKGQYQRVLLSLAFIGKPKLVFLDEPTTGLDPINRIKLRSVFKEFLKKGTTIIFSSHDITEVENLCNEIAIIHNNTITLHDTLENLMKRVNFKYKIIIQSNEIEKYKHHVQNFKFSIFNGKYIFYFNEHQELENWIKIAFSLNIHNFKIEQAGLIDFYFQYFGVDYDSFN